RLNLGGKDPPVSSPINSTRRRRGRCQLSSPGSRRGRPRRWFSLFSRRCRIRFGRTPLLNSEAFLVLDREMCRRTEWFYLPKAENQQRNSNYPDNRRDDLGCQ